MCLEAVFDNGCKMSMRYNISKNRVKLFWKQRSTKLQSSPLESVTNFEANNISDRMELEKKAIFGLVDFKPDWRIIDLGAGTGVWSLMFAPYVAEIVAVEYITDFIKRGRELFEKNGITNVKYIQKEAELFISKEKYDLVYISGLLLYLNDCDLERILSNMNYLNSGGYIILRESTAVDSRYIINNKYSLALEQDYSAVYRTRKEFEDIFNAYGFKLVRDRDVFPKNNPFDKFKETKLRVYLFVKK